MTNVCGIDKLCSGMWDNIEVGIYEINYIWKEHQEYVGCGLLPVDTKNSLNDINWAGMIWHIQHSWPDRSHFIFNT